MDDGTPADIRALDEQLSRTIDDAAALVAALPEELGAWRPAPGAWSVAECLDHLATADRVYLAAMRPAAIRARAAGRWRRGPAKPGLIGGWFARSLEPPPRPLLEVKAPRKIRPRSGPPLAAAYADSRRARESPGSVTSGGRRRIARMSLDNGRCAASITSSLRCG